MTVSEAKRADTSHSPRALAVGGIEVLDYRHIRGWAWYRPTPDEPIDVEILVDNTVVLRICADQPRLSR